MFRARIPSIFIINCISQSTVLTPHFKLLTPHSTLYTLHTLTLHSTLLTLHSALHTPHSTLSTPHSTLYTVHCALHPLPHSTRSIYSALVRSQGKNVDCSNILFHNSVLRGCIRVRGLHLVFIGIDHSLHAG